jgi:hypothetical protein
MDERQVVIGNSLPPDPQPTEVVVPAVRPFDDPSPRLLASDRSRQGRLSSTANVRLDVSLPSLAFGFRVIVALVEAKVVRHASPAAAQHDRVQRGTDHVLVVNVRARQSDAKRYAVSVGDNMPFRPEFGAIGWVGSCEVPPFGAFTATLSREAQAQSMPTCWS